VAGQGQADLSAEIGIHRDKAGTNDWFGFDLDNPSEVSPWVSSSEEMLQNEKMHDLLVKALQERRLQTPGDEEEPPLAETTATQPTGEVEAGAQY
jgi:hypothetical protein